MPLDTEDARSRLADLERVDASRIRRDIAALALPRLTGSDGAAEVEGRLRARFEELGYRTGELPFSFSALPGRFGLTVAGGASILAGLFGTWLLVSGLPVLSLLLLLLLLGIALAPLVFLEPGLVRLEWERVDARNLLFTRPEGRPSWILMAHRDTKSQRVPTLVRTGAVMVAGVAWAGLLALAAFWIGADAVQSGTLAWTLGVVLMGTGALLALSWAGNESPGALDNASGLAALLAVAERAGDGGEIAFLLTDGEELGLAGARAVARSLPPVQGVINVDGLDDEGPIHVAEGYGWARRGTAPQLASALLRAGVALGLPVSRRTLPRSLMVDHLPIAAAGMPALTVLRGTWASLLRVHRPADTAEAIDGTGAADTATLLLAALTLLRDQEAPHLARRRATGS